MTEAEVQVAQLDTLRTIRMVCLYFFWVSIIGGVLWMIVFLLAASELSDYGN